MATQTLTPRRAATLKAIAERQSTRRTGPTIKQIAEALSVAPFAVQRLVKALREAGLVEPESGYGLVTVVRRRGAVRLARAAGVVRRPLVKPGGKLL